MSDEFQIIYDSKSPILIQYQPKSLKREKIWEPRITNNWCEFTKNRNIKENATLLHVFDTSLNIVHVEPSINYRDIVGIRMCGTPHNAPYRALSALAVTVSSDGYWLLRERDSGDWPHSFEFVGGFVRANFESNNLDTFILQRFRREMVNSSLREYSCVGYCNFASILEHMYVYQIVTNETASQAIKNYGNSVLVISPSEIPMYISGATQASLPLHKPSLSVMSALLQNKVGASLVQKQTA